MLSAQFSNRLKILGTGSAVPDRIVTNDEAGQPVGVTDDWIYTKTGIRQRRWCEPGQATSDLASDAARVALSRAGIDASELSGVVVSTSTPDSPQPPTASVVADRIGVRPGTPAFDLNAVCSGFLFALTAASSLLLAASSGPILVVGADVYSRILDPHDRATVVLFGDGAGAAVLGVSSSGLIATRLATFPSYRGFIEVPGGGSRLAPSETTLRQGLHLFRMQGRKVREFVEETVSPAITDFLTEHGFAAQDVDHFIPHQANRRLITTLTEDLGLAPGALVQTCEHFGNTGSASIPLTLDHLVQSGGVRPGDHLLLAGFGGGMSIGLALIRAGSDGL